MCSNIEKSTPISRKSPQERYKKPQFDGFYWLSSDFLKQNTVYKSAEETQINQQWPSPHVAEIEGKAVEKIFL